MADDLQRLTLLTEAESGDLQPVLRVLKLLLDLGEEARETAEDLDRLGDESQEAGDDLDRFGDDARRAADDADKFDRQIEELSSTLAAAERRVEGLEKELGDLRKKLKAADDAAGGFGGGFKGASEALVGFQRRIGELALEKTVEAIRAGALAVAEFDEAMAQVRGLTEATAGQFERLRETAQDLGKTTRFTANEAAQLQAEFARAGFSIQEILDASAGALRLAQVGMMELGAAAGAAATQVRAFGGEAAQTDAFVDQLAKQANNAKTTVTDLAVATGKAAPSMVAMNAAMGDAGKSAIELQKEALALAGALANGGIEGEEAGVALSNLGIQLAQLQAPTAKQAETMRRLNLEADDLDPRIVGLQGAIENLAESNRKGGESFELVGSKAGRALAFLVENTDAVKANQAALEDASGFAERLAATYDDNLVGAYKAALSAAENLALVIGDSGASDAASTSLKILTDALRDNEEAAQAIGATFGTVAAGINAIANALVTGVTVSIDAVVVAAQGLSAALGDSLALASNVVGLFSDEMAEDWRLLGESMSEVARGKMTEAMRNLESAARKGADRFGEIGEDFRGIFGAVGEDAEDMSEKAEKAFDALGESSEKVGKLTEELEKATEATAETGEEADTTAQKMFDLSLAALELSDSVRDGLENLGGEELEAFRERSAEALEKTIASFIEFGEEVPTRLVEDLAKVSDAFDELPEKVGASLEAVREKAVELSAGIRAAMAEGFETPEELKEFADGVRPQIEALLDDFERLGQEAPPHLQEVAKAVGALPESLRQVRDEVQGILDEFISPDQIETQTEVIATAFEKISARTPQVKDRFRELTDSLIANAEAAGQAVPASIKAIRDELGITAEMADAAKEKIAGAFEGLSDSIVDWTGPGQASQIRDYFTELITGSDEMRAAFQALESDDALQLKGLIQGLVDAAREGSLTEDRLKDTEAEIRGLLSTAGDTDSVTAFNEAMSEVGDSGKTAATGTQAAADATKKAGVEYDAATQSVKQTAEATKEAGEAASGSAGQWGEAGSTIEQVKQAAEEVVDAAGRAGDGIAEAGEKAGEAAGDIGVLADGAQEAAAAQEEMSTQASAIAEALGPLSELLGKVGEADISALVTQLSQGADALVAIGQNADGLAASIGAAADEAARLAENLDAAEAGEGGGKG